MIGGFANVRSLRSRLRNFSSNGRLGMRSPAAQAVACEKFRKPGPPRASFFFGADIPRNLCPRFAFYAHETAQFYLLASLSR